jgi:hypothetical protein
LGGPNAYGISINASGLVVGWSELAGVDPAIMLGLAIVSLSGRAQDMSNGADNFYKSDKVTMQKVTFKNQYNMKVVGDLFIPKGLDLNTKLPQSLSATRWEP